MCFLIMSTDRAAISNHLKIYITILDTATTIGVLQEIIELYTCGMKLSLTVKSSTSHSCDRNFTPLKPHFIAMTFIWTTVCCISLLFFFKFDLFRRPEFSCSPQ